MTSQAYLTWLHCHSQFLADYTTQCSNKKAQADFGNALKVLNDHLKGKSFVVNDQITLADITIASTLLYPFKFVCDKKFLKPYGNVVRWFQACVSEPEVAAVVGKVEMCKTPLKAGQWRD